MMRLFKSIFLVCLFAFIGACGSSGEEKPAISESSPNKSSGGGYRIRLRPRQFKGEQKKPVPNSHQQNLQMKRP
jgi:hypothetical protein